MEHDKKMVLVDSRVLDQIKEKNVYEHEKVLGKKHSRPVERKVTSVTNLDIERIYIYIYKYIYIYHTGVIWNNNG